MDTSRITKSDTLKATINEMTAKGIDFVQMRLKILQGIIEQRVKLDVAQNEQYATFYPVNTTVVAVSNAIATATLEIGGNADFQCKFITASYTKSGGTAKTVKIQIFDKGRNINITNGFIPLHLIAGPGLSTQDLAILVPFRYKFNRNSQIEIQYTNDDGANTATVDFCFMGINLR